MTFPRWLGRQIGHVWQAVSADVGQRVVYRKTVVRRQVLPDRPELLLKRTTKDEVIALQKRVSK